MRYNKIQEEFLLHKLDEALIPPDISVISIRYLLVTITCWLALDKQPPYIMLGSQGIY
jgi:hypothetical protein